MELMEKLKLHSSWEAFLNYKTEQGTMTERELEELSEFVHSRAYAPVTEQICSTLRLSMPLLLEINKLGTGRKRTVFCFSQPEQFVLKLLAYLLKEYEYLLADNLYSFRMNHGVRRGIYALRRQVNLGHTWSYKVDIHNYFNSADPDRMLKILRKEMPAEQAFIRFFEQVLKDPYALQNGKPVLAEKGIMAGMPVSGFFANLYLKDLDLYFQERRIPYLRYSDDIIVFAGCETELQKYEQIIHRMLAEKGLEINEKKVIRTRPGEPIEFLGFCFTGPEIALAPVSIRKIKGKLKRRARSIYRWKIRKQVPDEKAALAYIRYLNRKFYGKPIRGEITWARWYFPLITTDRQLQEIDRYAVSCLRYVYAGDYSSRQYRLRYPRIRELGYQTLVNRYWNDRRERNEKEHDNVSGSRAE